MFLTRSHLAASPLCLALLAFAPHFGHAQAAFEVQASHQSSFHGSEVTEATASAEDFNANTTRLTSGVSGSYPGFYEGFTGPSSAHARGGADYTVTGIANGAPLTFTWVFSGSRTPSNAIGLAALEAGFASGSYTYAFSWEIDGIGPLEAGATITETGDTSGISLNFPTLWTGLGGINPQITIAMDDGASGTYFHRADISLGDGMAAAYSIQLQSVTVPEGSYLTGPAFMNLDNGQFLPITVVPEPSAYAGLAGLAVVGGILLRRRKTIADL